MTRPEARPFVPALAFHRLTGVYDRLAGRWPAYRHVTSLLADAVSPPASGRVLDVGRGTGAVSLLVKRNYPDAEVTGIDLDPAILAVASAKAARGGTAVTLVEADATALPFPDGSFDRAISCLMFHHLTRPAKQTAFREVLRVLRPGGELHLADFDRPHTLRTRLAFSALRRFDGLAQTADNARGLPPELGQAAGFVGWERTARFATLLGTVAVFRAVKPAAGDGGVPC